MMFNQPKRSPVKLPSCQRGSANAQQRPQVLLFHGLTNDSLDAPAWGA
jgi:hypothetical protein